MREQSLDFVEVHGQNKRSVSQNDALFEDSSVSDTETIQEEDNEFQTNGSMLSDAAFK